MHPSVMECKNSTEIVSSQESWPMDDTFYTYLLIRIMQDLFLNTHHPLRALCTHCESFSSLKSLAEILMTFSCHPSPWPNFSMTAYSCHSALIPNVFMTCWSHHWDPRGQQSFLNDDAILTLF